MNKLVQAELITTAILVGLIWMVQLVTYPSFAYVAKENYQIYHSQHVMHITPLVAPLMILELTLAFTNLVQKNYDLKFAIAGLILLIIIWAATAFLSVPIHNELVLNKNELLITKLINSNWIRTLAWSSRLGILIIIINQTNLIPSK